MPSSTKLRTVYTVAQIAEWCDVSKRRAARLLESAGVQFVMSGNTRHVPISELLKKAEWIIDSARIKEQFIRLARLELQAEAIRDDPPRTP